MMQLPEAQRGEAKTGPLPAHRTIEIHPVATLRKPEWIRVRLSDTPPFREVKRILRLHDIRRSHPAILCPSTLWISLMFRPCPLRHISPRYGG